MGREHREEVVDRRTVSTTHKYATDKVKRQTWVRTFITQGKRKGRTIKNTSRDKEREKSDMSKCVFCTQCASLSGPSLKVVIPK